MKRFITGIELSHLIHHRWPDGWYVEDFPEDIEDDKGNLLIAHDEIVDLDNMGYVVMNKDGENIGLRSGRARAVSFMEFYNHLEKRKHQK